MQIHFMRNSLRSFMCGSAFSVKTALEIIRLLRIPYKYTLDDASITPPPSFFKNNLHLRKMSIAVRAFSKTVMGKKYDTYFPTRKDASELSRIYIKVRNVGNSGSHG